MVQINIDNLKRTDRPLTWLPEPTCDRCSLPFTNHADELYNRLPLLLSCNHLLCGLCVREHAQRDNILCERCNKRVPLPDNCDNATDTLHPSYYMLGMMSQMQQELKCIEQYYGDESMKVPRVKVTAAVNETHTGMPTESLSTRDISTTKKMKSLLEEAFDSYEKTSHLLHKRAKSYPENVDRVVHKINGHFLELHNALQIEQDRALQLVRQTYLEQQQLIEQQQQHLSASKKRLKELHMRLKSFHGKTMRSDDRSWMQFSGEVKLFLAREPLKLSASGGSGQLAEFFTQSDKFFPAIGTSYRLKLANLNKMGQLVPFTSSKKHTRDESGLGVNEPSAACCLPTHSTHERSDRYRQQEHGAKRTVSVNEQTMPESTYSTWQRKFDDRTKHHQPAARSIGFYEETIPARERKHSGEEGARHSTAMLKPVREKKRSKTSLRTHEPRIFQEADKTTLKRCFSMVTVTCVVDPREIYVRDELHDDAAEKVVELCREEAEDYEVKLLSGECHLNVKVGEIYLVQPENSNDCHRALVLDVLNPTPEQLGPYRVRYVDYGGLDTVEHYQMRPISEDLSTFGSLAIKCSLYNILPLGRTATSCPEECYQLMMDFIGNRKMLLYEVNTTSDHRVVDLFLPPINATKNPTVSDTKKDVMYWDGYYSPMSLRTMLINLQQCSSNEAFGQNSHTADRLWLLRHWMRQATAQAQKRWTIPRAPVLAEFDFFDVHITHSKSPDNFYVMPLEWKKNKFDQLQEQLNVMCQQTNAYKVFCPYEGLVCGFALDTQDSDRVWLRGQIEKIEPGSCWMFALDTGESMKVSLNDLYLFAPGSEPMYVHPLAVCCSLEHIRPKGVEAIPSWSEVAIDDFNMLMKSKTLRFAVTMGPLWNESKVYSVLLYLRNKSDLDTCVNKMLVSQGHAECMLGKEAEIVDLVHKPDIREMNDKVATAAAAAGAAESNKVIDPRVPVDLLRVISPSEIYVRLSSRKDDLDGLHRAIQQHMDEALDGDVGGSVDSSEDKNGWGPGDMCLVFTAPPNVNTIEWYRARITEVQEEEVLYEAFLIDRALTVQVHRTNVARMVPRIAQLQPGAVRCQLACIEPLKGTTGWRKVTVDGLNNIINSYVKHAISLDAKLPKNENNEAPSPKQTLSVVLWGVRVLERQALAPQKTEYKNINQLLVARGLAHSSGRFRTFATKGNGALEELQSVEEEIEKVTRCEYEKLQQFFREIATVSAEAEGFGAPESGYETAQTVLNGEETQARVEIDGACATMLLLVNDVVEPITCWPIGEQLEKTVFVGMPTHIGNDGTVYLYDMCQEPVLRAIRDTIVGHIAKHGLSAPVASEAYKLGEPCLAKFHLDGLFYRATVVAVIKRNKYRVQFVDYGNEEICHGSDLRKETVCCRVPIQTNRFRLSGIVPKQRCNETGAWPEDALNICHGVIVQKLCKVIVNTSNWSPNYNEEAKTCRPILCSLFRLDDSIDVCATLLEMASFKKHLERKEPSEEGFSSGDRHVSKRYRKIEYPMTDAVPTRYHSPTRHTPDERDLLQFVQELDSSRDSDSYRKAFEDPNELPDIGDDGSDYLNHAQVLNIDSADHSDTSYDSSRSSYSSLMSPATFIACDLDSSTRMSGDELDFQPNMQNDQLQPASGPFASPIGPMRTMGFWANFVKYDSNLTLHIFPQIEGHSLRSASLEGKVNRIAKSQTELLRWQASLVEVGEPCLAPYGQSGHYYRAIIEKVHEARAEVTVLYVDHLNRGTVPIANLRKCSKELRTIPLRNVEVRLSGVRRNPRIREEDISRRLEEVLAKSFYVRIVPFTNPSEPGEAVKLGVQLYSDYEQGILAYQPMIDERFLYRIVQ